MSQRYPLPKHAPLLIALTEKRDTDSETYLGKLLSEHPLPLSEVFKKRETCLSCIRFQSMHLCLLH